MTSIIEPKISFNDLIRNPLEKKYNKLEDEIEYKVTKIYTEQTSPGNQREVHIEFQVFGKQREEATEILNGQLVKKFVEELSKPIQTKFDGSNLNVGPYTGPSETIVDRLALKRAQLLPSLTEMPHLSCAVLGFPSDPTQIAVYEFKQGTQFCESSQITISKIKYLWRSTNLAEDVFATHCFINSEETKYEIVKPPKNDMTWVFNN